jgi:hypothetical protein
MGPTLERLERALPNIDSPYGIALCHTRILCSTSSVRKAAAPLACDASVTHATANCW